MSGAATFREFWDLGYRRLASILPPDAPAAERLAKRIASSKKDPRGKAPGMRRADGLWHGYDFTTYDPTEADLDKWQSWGAGIGLKTGALGDGRLLLFIDADTMDKSLAKIIAETVDEHFGDLPMRVGKYPKAGYVIACNGPFPYKRVEFGDGERCEILSNNRQFVAHGVHTDTRKPYHWPRALVPLSDLTTTTPEALDAFLADLKRRLPAAKDIVEEGGGASNVNQEHLKAPVEHVARAVKALPNTTELFPTREAYRDVGYAIKAALADHPAEAFAIFDEWSDRWTDAEDGSRNDEGYAAAEWARMKPPFRRGASWLFELADAHAPREAFNIGEAYDLKAVTPEEEAANRHEIAAKIVSDHAQAMAATPDIEWFTPFGRWHGQQPAPREWIVEGFIPKGETTLLYGDGGIGKTLLAHQLATCIAAGLAWLGQKTITGRVMCFLAEDKEQELHRRQLAINAGLGFDETEDATGDRLWISCRRDSDNLLALFERNGAMTLTPAWHKLKADAIRHKADFIILDTLADIFAGDEINRNQVTQFVKGCLGRLGSETGASIMVLGHPSKSGQQSGAGTSGSTAWSNAVRSRLYLQYPDKVTKGDHRELVGMKSNYGPKGSVIKLKWSAGHFIATSASNAAHADKSSQRLFEKTEGSNVVDIKTGAPTVPNSADAADRALLDTVESMAGEQLGSAKNSPYYLPKRVKAIDPLGLLEGFPAADIEEAFARLVRQKLLEPTEVGRKNRNPLYGFTVHRPPAGQNVVPFIAPGGVFE